MRKSMLGLVAGLVGLGLAGGIAFAAADAGRGPDMQRMMEDHAAMLDAQLAGLKAALKLTPDQEKLWAPFEASVRDAAKMRADHMQALRATMQAGKAGPSPIDRLDMMATGMEDGAKALHGIAAAGKPLYAALDEGQQRRFAFLGRMMLDHGHGPDGHRHGGPGMMGDDMAPPPAPAAQ
jgi:hypothetical protein